MEDRNKGREVKHSVCTHIVGWVMCAVVLVLSLEHRHAQSNNRTQQADTIVDYRVRTIVKVDTIVLSPPIAPLLIVQLPSDTIRIEEPTTLNRVQATYEDSLYRAVVSGYIDARLDELTIYQRNKTERIESNIFVKSRKRWGLGLQAGYGTGGTYLGVGICYNLFSW